LYDRSFAHKGHRFKRHVGLYDLPNVLDLASGMGLGCSGVPKMPQTVTFQNQRPFAVSAVGVRQVMLDEGTLTRHRPADDCTDVVHGRGTRDGVFGNAHGKVVDLIDTDSRLRQTERDRPAWATLAYVSPSMALLTGHGYVRNT
jgi:hypothetical protein